MSRPFSFQGCTPAEAGFDPAGLARLAARFSREIDNGVLPGAVVLLVRGGRRVLFEAWGRQDPARPTPMARDAVFRIYSMTKPIVSLAAMMLIEEGLCQLGDPVARYLPEFAHSKVYAPEGGASQAPTRPATVQDLLRHTAGLALEIVGDTPVHRMYADAGLGGRRHDNAESARIIAGLPLLFPPGKVWEYSRATDVLGRLIEVLGGQTLGEFLRARIFAPLAMVDTGFFVPEAAHHRIAEPHANDPESGTPVRLMDLRKPMAWEGGSGGLASTAYDYALFLQCLLDGGALAGTRLVAPSTVALMTADHLGPIRANPDTSSATLLPPGHGFGLGFAVRTQAGIAPFPGNVGTYYWGGLGGTHFFVDPALDLFGILMAQAPMQRDRYRVMFRNLVYAAIVD